MHTAWVVTFPNTLLKRKKNVVTELQNMTLLFGHFCSTHYELTCCLLVDAEKKTYKYICIYRYISVDFFTAFFGGGGVFKHHRQRLT